MGIVRFVAKGFIPKEFRHFWSTSNDVYTYGRFHQHFSLAITHADPKSTKMQSSHQSLCTFGICAVKALHKMLVKLSLHSFLCDTCFHLFLSLFLSFLLNVCLLCNSFSFYSFSPLSICSSSSFWDYLFVCVFVSTFLAHSLIHSSCLLSF